jgi:hypothetical protein
MSTNRPFCGLTTRTTAEGVLAVPQMVQRPKSADPVSGTGVVPKRFTHHVVYRLSNNRRYALHYDKSTGVYYEVYVNPVAGEKLDIHTPGYVGNLSLFALKPHAMAGHLPPPTTDVYVEYDISHLALAAMANNPKDLTVALVPRGLFDAQNLCLCRRRRTAR